MDGEKIIEDIEDGILMARATATKLVHLPVDKAEDIVELLKKQEAVKPINAFKRVNGTMAYSCPRCAALIVDGSYCKHCGQAVKWDGTFQIQY